MYSLCLWPELGNWTWGSQVHSWMVWVCVITALPFYETHCQHSLRDQCPHVLQVQMPLCNWLPPPHGHISRHSCIFYLWFGWPLCRMEEGNPKIHGHLALTEVSEAHCSYLQYGQSICLQLHLMQQLLWHVPQGLFMLHCQGTMGSLQLDGLPRVAGSKPHYWWVYLSSSLSCATWCVFRWTICGNGQNALCLRAQVHHCTTMVDHWIVIPSFVLNLRKGERLVLRFTIYYGIYAIRTHTHLYAFLLAQGWRGDICRVCYNDRYHRVLWTQVKQDWLWPLHGAQGRKQKVSHVWNAHLVLILLLIRPSAKCYRLL